MHNAASEALGLDRVYVALRVAPADLGPAVRGLRALGVEGANVTLPHKAAAVPLCDELGDEARDAGAVNTLSFTADGRMRGDLSDGLGLVDGARSGARAGRHPRCRWQCARGGRRAGPRWDASAHGRRPPPRGRGRAGRRSLRARPGAQVVGAAAMPDEPGGLLVHCTPVGGITALKQLPVPADAIEHMDAVADFAYRADGSPTPLADVALAAGVPVVDGLELLVRQGAISFRRWTGVEPPLGVMRRAARGG